MRSVAALLAALCGCGVAGIQADGYSAFEVGIHLHVDRSIASKVVLRELESETESLWAPYGVQLEWADDRTATEDDANGFVLEASVDRRLDGPALPEWAAVLGHAFVDIDGPSRRPIRVSFDATERMLAQRTNTQPSTTRMIHEREMARALGRVLAHEIGHVLLAAPYHDATGLMRAVFTPDELAAQERTPFRLACNGVGRLRSRIRVLTGNPRFANRLNWVRFEPVGNADESEVSGAGHATCIPGSHSSVR